MRTVPSNDLHYVTLLYASGGLISPLIDYDTEFYPKIERVQQALPFCTLSSDGLLFGIPSKIEVNK